MPLVTRTNSGMTWAESSTISAMANTPSRSKTMLRMTQPAKYWQSTGTRRASMPRADLPNNSRQTASKSQEARLRP